MVVFSSFVFLFLSFIISVFLFKASIFCFQKTGPSYIETKTNTSQEIRLLSDFYPFFIFSFGLNVILNCPEYLKIYHLWMHSKDCFFYYYKFPWKRRSFAYFIECAAIKCETLTAFIMNFVVNHKKPAMAVGQFFRLFSILVPNSSIGWYFDKQTFNIWALLF